MCFGRGISWNKCPTVVRSTLPPYAWWALSHVLYSQLSKKAIPKSKEQTIYFSDTPSPLNHRRLRHATPLT